MGNNTDSIFESDLYEENRKLKETLAKKDNQLRELKEKIKRYQMTIAKLKQDIPKRIELGVAIKLAKYKQEIDDYENHLLYLRKECDKALEDVRCVNSKYREERGHLTVRKWQIETVSKSNYGMNLLLVMMEDRRVSGDLISDVDVISQWERLAIKTQQVANALRVFVQESAERGRRNPVLKQVNDDVK